MRLHAVLLAVALASVARAQDGLELVDHEGDLRVVDAATGLATARTIVVSPEVQERLTVSWRALPWREALDTWARIHRCEVEELAPDVFWLDRPTPIEARFEASDVRGVLERIAALAGANVLVAPDVEGEVTIALEHVPWREALERVAAAAGLRLVERAGGVLVALPRGRELPPLERPAPPTPAQLARQRAEPRLTLETTAVEPLEDVAERLGALAGVNALVDPNVRETVPPLVLRGVPWRLALELLARLTRTTLEERPGGILVYTQPPDTTYAAAGAPAARWFELLAAEGELQVDVGAIGSVTIDARLRRVRAEDALVATAEAVGLTVARVDSALVVRPGAAPIGSRAAVAPASVAEAPLDLEAFDAALAEGLTAALAGDHEAASAALRRLSDLLRGAPERSRAARARVVARWSERLARDTAFAAAVDFGLCLALGHTLERALAKAVGRGDVASAERLADELAEHGAAMTRREHEDHVLQGTWFRAMSKLHRRDLAATSAALGRPLTVMATVTSPLGPRRALVNGSIVEEGEVVPGDPATPPVSVFWLLPDGVELRCGDVVSWRPLGGP